MLGQHHDRARADQALGASVFKVGGELAVQQGQVLVVARIQQWLDAQQIALVGGHALVQRHFNTKVGQVVAGRALFGPQAIAQEHGSQNKRQGAKQKFSHGIRCMSAVASRVLETGGW